METGILIVNLPSDSVDSSPTLHNVNGSNANPTLATNICLLGLTFDSPNLGVGALLDGSLRGILACNPNAKLSVLDYGYDRMQRSIEFDGRLVPIDFVNLRFSKRVYLANNIAYLLLLSAALRYLAPARMRKFVIDRNSTLRHISTIDIAASIAGGDSFSDIYGLSRLLYEALPQALVLLMGKRLVLLPQTIGPFKGRWAQWIAKALLSRAELVCSRDYAGMKEAQSFVGETNAHKIRFCYDLGFLVKPKKTDLSDLDELRDHKERGSSIVGFNVSGLLLAGGYSRNNMFGLKADYEQLVKSAVRFLIEEKGSTVLLVPHVRSEPTGASVESDEHACKLVYDEFRLRYPGKVLLVRDRYDVNEMKYIIGMCDLFIGSRMHACIAALSQGIPAVAISYSDKFAGVMETMGVSELVADPRKMQIQEILDVVGHTYDQRESIGRQLLARMPNVTEQTLASLEMVVST